MSNIYSLGWCDNSDDYYLGDTTYPLGCYSSKENLNRAISIFQKKVGSDEFPFIHGKIGGYFVCYEIQLDSFPEGEGEEHHAVDREQRNVLHREDQ